MYIYKTINFKAIGKLSNKNKYIENLSIEIIRKN